MYRDKLVFCNNMISQLFQEESICCYLHSFFLDILKHYGYANGSEVCFLIIAFCDYKFNIFNTQHPIEQIFHVYKGNKILKEENNMLIKVVDDKLIDYTGGIVKGMSGAPIIQNNKLIGSLTYVFKHNSKKGYGIFIDEMLKL